jgi:hypothetical protein
MRLEDTASLTRRVFVINTGDGYNHVITTATTTPIYSHATTFSIAGGAWLAAALGSTTGSTTAGIGP